MALTKTLGGSGGGGGSAPDIQEEGSTVQAGASRINFVGGATATSDGSGGAIITLPAAKYSIWDPFIPDVSPHADTDEFTSSSTISNWTGVTTGDAGVVNNIATTLGRGMYFEATQSFYRLRSRMKAIPAGDFTVHTVVNLAAHTAGGTDLCATGILLADGTTAAAGKQTGVVLAQNNGTIRFGGRLSWANYGNDATSAALDNTEPIADVVFLRLRRVGATYSMAWSNDGDIYSERTLTLLAGLTPTHLGLFLQNYASTLASSKFTFYRVYATGTQYRTGALRTVYG